MWELEAKEARRTPRFSTWATTEYLGPFMEQGDTGGAAGFSSVLFLLVFFAG